MKHRIAILILLIIIIGGSLVLESCRKKDPPFFPERISFNIPPGWPAPVYNFNSNPLSKEGFTLGKKLFYDGILSIDGNFPCSSCHEPAAAYTTKDHDRSHGYNNSHTIRNAPGLFNLAWYPYFNQDGSANNLHDIYRKHITDPTEMAETITNVLNKLNANATYRSMFKNAFGGDEIREDMIYRALDQFLVKMVSADSKYDRVMRGEDSFNPAEQQGYQVFQSNCASCHVEPLFTDFSFRNVGLEINMNLNDFGRMMVTGNPADSLKFRVPSLRNVEFTSYYLHDGRVSLPRHVIQHYRFNINQSATLDPSLVNGIQLTDLEEDNLVRFMRTLSDSVFLNNPEYRQ